MYGISHKMNEKEWLSRSKSKLNFVKEQRVDVVDAYK